MSRERRLNFFLACFFLIGLALSAVLYWSLDQWSKERWDSEFSTKSTSWAHRLSREVESDLTSLASYRLLLSDLNKVDRQTVESLMASLLADDSIRALAWVPEITEENLEDYLEGYPEFQQEERRLKTVLEVTKSLFPVSLLEGESRVLRTSMELSQDPQWSEALKGALEEAKLHPRAFDSGTSEAGMLLFQPLRFSSNQKDERGLLVAEVHFSDYLDRSGNDDAIGVGLQVYDTATPQRASAPLYSYPEALRSTLKEHLSQSQLDIGAKKWSVAFTPLENLPTFSWEALMAGVLGLVTTLSILQFCRTLFTKASYNKVLAEESSKALKTKEVAYQESVAKLNRAEELYSDLFDKSQALIWTQSTDGKIESVNPAAAKSLGYKPEEMTGRSLRDFVLPTERHNFGNYLERCVKSNTSRGLLKLYTKNGATCFWMYQTSLSRDEKEQSVRCHALDVTESQQAERELERLSRRNELILESVGEGIYGINLAGECTFVNPAALSFTGYTRRELMSADRTMHEILQPTKGDSSDYPWEECASFATLSDGEIRRVTSEYMLRKDGSPFPVDYVVTPILGDDERILGAVVTFRDITQRRAVEQMKNEFISIVSHELRTPLTSIRGSLGLLASGLLLKFPQKADKMLKIAVENTDRLVRLINDILDIERLESGKVTVELSEVNLGELMKGAADTMTAMANENKVEIDVEVAETAVWADSDRVLQVLTNLLSNAIKFSPEGGVVKLFSEPLTEGEKRGWIRVCVADHGRGIPEEKTGKIFERFGQVDASDSREKGGTGLGLPICKTIVQQHGGELWVESVLGEGSQFYFTLPTEPREEPPQ